MGAVAATTLVTVLASGVATVGAWADAGAGSTAGVQGSESAGKWPLIQTLGIFAGIPVAAAVVIVLLVFARPAIRAGRESIGTEAFSGPHAGVVDPIPTATPDAADRAPAPAQGGAGAEW